MKKLILIRHAKSDWSDFNARDFDRELNARGKHDAPVMGQRLAARGKLPDAFVVSTARRAKATAELIAPALGFAVADIQWKDELYLSSPSTMKAVIRQSTDHVQTLALEETPSGFPRLPYWDTSHTGWLLHQQNVWRGRPSGTTGGGGCKPDPT